MPSRFGISKKLHLLFVYSALALLASILLALVYGCTQLARYSEPFPVEWAGEASSILLRFDKKNPYSARAVFVSHTPFGQRMVDEYKYLNQAINPGSPREDNEFYTAISGDLKSLGACRYLNYFAFAKLKATHFQHTLFSRPITAPSNLVDHSPAIYLEALFTRGLYKQPDNTLVDKLRSLIQKAEPGSYIRFSVFLFFYENQNEPILLDLLAAAERGVNVQLIIDLPESDNPERRGIGYAFQSSFDTRIRAAAIKGNSDSWLKNHSSVDWDSKNHTKIFLFSNSAGFKNWLIFTSENLTDTERQKYQAGLLIRDKYSYDAFDKYWTQILQGSYTDLWAASSGGNLTHYFFPQTTNEDAIYQQLDQITVKPDGAQQGKLLISMARWNFERFPLAMKLVELAENGINIEIVTRNNPQIVDEVILKALSHRPNITLHTADVDRLNIHSKYILYDGYYQDKNPDEPEVPKKILWVGSHNFTGMAMRNNYETWSEVRDDKIFQAYSENFSELGSLVPVDPDSGNTN